MAYTGPAELAAWLKRSQRTSTQLAAQLSISRPYMSQLLTGKRTPSMELAARIFEVTGVPMIAWLDIPVSGLERGAS